MGASELEAWGSGECGAIAYILSVGQDEWLLRIECTRWKLELMVMSSVVVHLHYRFDMT